MKVRNLYILLPFMLFIDLAMNGAQMFYIDLVLLMVLFGGVFLEFESAIKFGVLASVLRGFFASGILAADVIVIIALVGASNLISVLFYRENVFIQALLGTAFISLIIFFDSFIIKTSTGAQGSVFGVLLSNWSVLIASGIATPVLFAILKKTTFST